MSPRDHDGAPPGEPFWTRRHTGSLDVEITLRGVDPLDDLVYFIKRCACGLEDVFDGSARCTITVHSIWRGNARVFDVELGIVGTSVYGELRHLDADLFLAVRDAFEHMRIRLQRAHSGVVSRAEVGLDPNPEASGEDVGPGATGS